MTFKEKLARFIDKEPKPSEMLAFVIILISVTISFALFLGWVVNIYGTWTLLVFPALSAAYLLHRILKA